MNGIIDTYIGQRYNIEIVCDEVVLYVTYLPVLRVAIVDEVTLYVIAVDYTLPGLINIYYVTCRKQNKSSVRSLSVIF